MHEQKNKDQIEVFLCNVISIKIYLSFAVMLVVSSIKIHVPYMKKGCMNIHVQCKEWYSMYKIYFYDNLTLIIHIFINMTNV